MGKDILLDKDGDLLTENGDFVIGYSVQSEIERLLLSHKGEWKEHPLVGGGMIKLLKSREGQTKALQEARKQLQGDGFEIANIEINGHNIDIDADRI